MDLDRTGLWLIINGRVIQMQTDKDQARRHELVIL